MQLNERLGQFIGMVEHDRLLGPDARLARCLASMFNPHLYPGIGPRCRSRRRRWRSCRPVAAAREPGAAATRAGGPLLRIDYGGITVIDLAGLRAFDD